MSQFDVDPDRGATHQHLINHLSGPLAGGAVRTRLALAGDGTLAVTWTTREPLAWLAPARDLGDEVWTVSVRLDPAGADVALPPLRFDAFTERGAALPLYVPPVNDLTHTSVPFTLALGLERSGPDVPGAVVADAGALNDFLTLGLVEGVMGRVLFLLGAENPKMRRQAREIRAMRRLRYARRNALDRHGADLGVPRFVEDIAFQQTGGDGEPFAGEIITITNAEADDDYRRRLRLYQPFVTPNFRSVLELLNGPGAQDDPNAGLLGELGLAERFRLLEADNIFGVAIHLIAVDNDAYRANFLDYIRRVYLVYPVANAANDQRHGERFISRFRREQVQALRERLAASFTFDSEDIGLAPMLAEKLDVAGRALDALGVGDAPRILRGQAGNAGSRYELGLGADISAFTDNQRAQLVDAVTLLQGQDERLADAEIDALLRSMRPAPADRDIDAEWFFRACGMQTVHRLNANTLYVSHFPTSGMMITGESAAALSADVPLEARYQAEGDPGANVVLRRALRRAERAWAESGGQPWQAIGDADAPAVWQRADAIGDAQPAALVLRAAGLYVVNNPQRAIEPLAAVPAELHETIVLDDALGTAIIENTGDAVDQLRRLVGIFRDAGVVSILPLVADGQIVLVLGVIGLPEVGINLSQRRATGFRWYVVPIQTQSNAPKFEFKTIGSRTTFQAMTGGLYALVAIGYARTGDTDPYEYRVELPADAVLTLRQYEFLMNLLERSYPVGVEVNTFTIRSEHVDLNGDGAAEPLTPSVARTYRPFVRRRHRGQTGIDSEAAE